MKRLLILIAMLLTPVLFGCPELGISGDGFLFPDTGGTDTGNGINPAEPAGEPVPEVGEPVSIVVINESGVEAGVRVRLLVGDVQVRETVFLVPAGRIMDVIGPDLATRIEIDGLFVTGDPTPTVVWLLGQDFSASDLMQYILRDSEEEIDNCPDDPDKTEPGICGCGVPDTDRDDDGTPDCNDECPDDPNKTVPGVCGCDKVEDANNNGVPDCQEGRPRQPEKEACCFGSGSCDDLTPSDCTSLEGTPQGTGTTCETTTCYVPPPTEACCFDGGSCSDVEPDACIEDNGTPQGPETTCATTTCYVPPPTVACCFSDGSCLDVELGACIEGNGTSQGPQTTCATTTCYVPPPTEACCLNDGSCLDVEPDMCQQEGGTPQGADTTCSTTVCYVPPPMEACCLQGECVDMDPYACMSMEGQPQGPGTICEPGMCAMEPLPLGVLVVKWDAPPGGNGESWATAFQSLQSALTKAAISHGLNAMGSTEPVWTEIWVARGTYKPDDNTGDRGRSFYLLPGVGIYGGFTGNETERAQRDIVANPTILSGNINQPDDDTDNSHHVVRAEAYVVTPDALDGFIIEKGYAPGGGDQPNTGAGILISGASPGLNNLIFRHNSAAVAGGGMYIQSGAPRLYRCTFESNIAGQKGGAIYAQYCFSLLIRCDFGSNQATDLGGAVANEGCSLYMVNCRFIGNTATAMMSAGGAVWSGGDNPLTEMMNCRLSGNSAGMGGGVCHTYDTGTAIINSTINSLTRLVNCTLNHNSSIGTYQGGGGVYRDAGNVEVINSIVWENTGGTGYPDTDAIWPMGDGVTVNYSCVPGTWGTMNNNTNIDPQFADADGPDDIPDNWDDNLMPTAGLPVVDGGDDTAILPDFGDLDGDGNVSEPTPRDLVNRGRIIGDAVDMGAYEDPPM